MADQGFMRDGASKPAARIASEFGQMRAGALNREKKVKPQEVKESEEPETTEEGSVDFESISQPKLKSLAFKKGYTGTKMDKVSLIEFLKSTS